MTDAPTPRDGRPQRGELARARRAAVKGPRSEASPHGHEEHPPHRPQKRGEPARAQRAGLLTLTLILLATGAGAQEISVDLGTGGDLLSERIVQMMILITVLSLVPGLAVMVTCFPFMVTVLAILRQGIGLQTSPPNILIISLALFLTYFVMEPVFLEAWATGISPMADGVISTEEGIVRAIEPFRGFMATRVDPDTFVNLADLRGEAPDQPMADAPLSILIPSFLLSEIERAFQVGFLIFLPFLVIDLVVAAILMSMGMMMVPPAIVSLPFKLAFFVVADGWTLVSGALVQSYF